MRSVKFLTPAEKQKLGAQEQGDRPMTNLEVFRQQMYDYLYNHPAINNQMTLMVRELTAADTGIPIELYAFTKTKVWEEYEEIQARLVEYALAMLPKYGLVIFQRGGLPAELLEIDKN